MPTKLSPAPRQRGDARRNTLLQTAARLFLEHGFEATSVGVIAVTANASKETLYRYFPTKEELFVESLLHRGNELAAELFFDLRPEDPPRKALQQFGVKLLQWVQREELFLFYRTLATEHLRFPGLTAAFYELGPVRTQASLRTYLQSQIALGQLRRHDTTVAARQLFGLLVSLTVMRGELGLNTQTTEAGIQQHVRETLDCFFRGYASLAKAAAKPRKKSTGRAGETPSHPTHSPCIVSRTGKRLPERRS